MSASLLKWDQWSPGLEIEDMKLGEVLQTLPAAAADDVPEIIRKYENPESKYALPGSIELKRHDCIHILLGRGLHVQDEAFVIGFTMGAASDFTYEHQEIYERVSVEEFPPPWNFQKSQLFAYRLGIGLSEDIGKSCRDIHLFPLENDENLDRTVGDLRKQFGIIKGELRAYYKKEWLLIPESRASLRLDILSDVDDTELFA